MGFAIKMKSPMKPAAAPPAPADDEAGEDESSESCSASINADQLDELQQKGTVTLQSDDGESVVLTMDESDQESPEGGEGE